MSQLSKTRLAYPCFATPNIAWPISAVVKTDAGNARRTTGNNGLASI